MNPRLLHIFVNVSETLSMTETAKRLYLSQPAVSAAIRDLENDLEVVLFERINRHLILTPAGAQLLDVARQVLDLHARAQASVKATHQASPLRLGSSITIGIKLLPNLVAEFQRRHPAVSVSVTVHNTDTITAMVADHRLDVGLVEGQVPLAPLTAIPFLRDELTVIAPPNHPCSSLKAVPLSELTRYPLLMRDVDSGTRRLADAALLQHGITLRPAWESISTLALIEAVKAGLGLSILPLRLVDDALKRHDVVTLPVPELTLSRDFLIVTYQDKYLSASLNAFIELVKTNAIP